MECYSLLVENCFTSSFDLIYVCWNHHFSFLILLTAVVFKLSKRKVDDNLQVLHTILFGRKSNVKPLNDSPLFCVCAQVAYITFSLSVWTISFFSCVRHIFWRGISSSSRVLFGL